MKENKPPLRYYHDSWWKVDGKEVYYLGGRDNDPDLKPGWYFANEASMFSDKYDSREEAERALAAYAEHLR